MDDALVQHALDLLQTNRYLTLGTVDDEGKPWVSPVYFAVHGLRDFFWVSDPNAHHSRHLHRRPQVSLVVFDSTVEPYHGRALYARGYARQLDGDAAAKALDIYPGPSERGGSKVVLSDVIGDAPWRIYHANATEVSVLCPRSPRQPCPRHHLATDHRTAVALPDDAPTRAPEA
jgi:hypothetical protein